jgi:hypothetical protein
MMPRSGQAEQWTSFPPFELRHVSDPDKKARDEAGGHANTIGQRLSRIEGDRLDRP